MKGRWGLEFYTKPATKTISEHTISNNDNNNSSSLQINNTKGKVKTVYLYSSFM